MITITPVELHLKADGSRPSEQDTAPGNRARQQRTSASPAVEAPAIEAPAVEAPARPSEAIGCGGAEPCVRVAWGHAARAPPAAPPHPSVQRRLLRLDTAPGGRRFTEPVGTAAAAAVVESAGPPARLTAARTHLLLRHRRRGALSNQLRDFALQALQGLRQLWWERKGRRARRSGVPREGEVARPWGALQARRTADGATAT